MSLLGIDIGTTGCKASLFRLDGSLLAQGYEEYDVSRPHPGWAELDANEVWGKIKRTIAAAAGKAGGDPVTALAVSSMGEALVPVTRRRRILGPSLLNFDTRGSEYLESLGQALPPETLYRINGNILANHYGLPKLKWIKQYQPALYAETDLFLHWSGFVSFMLGAEPTTDRSLANRSLLFDLERCDWSDQLLDWAGLDRVKLPEVVPAGVVIGRVSPELAEELGLGPGIQIVSGAHDQCANAAGCGVIREGQAIYGMGTYNCVTPVFNRPRPPAQMLAAGLCSEHHAAPDCFVSFIYNMGGGLVKWYRDTFAAAEHRQARSAGRDVYTDLFAEMSREPSSLLVYPHFNNSGFPEFRLESSGMILGLRLETRRADILKAILEANVFSLKEPLDALPGLGIPVGEYRASGGGSKSDAGVQLCADILGRTFVRPAVSEAGTLGAAILAGAASGQFASIAEAAGAMVHLERTFEPDPALHARYQERYAEYSRLRPMFGEFVSGLSSAF